MITSNIGRWFVRLCIVGLLLLSIVLFKYSALTQERDGSDNLDQAPAVTEEGSSGLTDDPLGRVFIPLDDGDPPSSNLPSDQADNGASQLSSAELLQLEVQAASVYASPLVIPAAEFGDDGAKPDSLFFSFDGGFWNGESQKYGCMMAPAYLPHNVRVEEMYVSVYDDDATFDVSADLRRVDNFNGDTDTMATVSSSGTNNSLQVVVDLSIDFPNTRYPDYSYYVTTCLQSVSTRLYSVRLYYANK